MGLDGHTRPITGFTTGIRPVVNNYQQNLMSRLGVGVVTASSVTLGVRHGRFAFYTTLDKKLFKVRC